jgi:hypothetical protein
VAVLARVVFIASTGRIWEDALITVTHAESVYLGIGLTHHDGEGPTHGFTSAISVLLPLLGEGIARGAGIAALQLASIGAAVVALVFARATAVGLGLSAQPRVFVLMFLAVEQNHVFYGAAGMETQIAVAVLLGAFCFAARGSVAGTGLAAGLALLARPDFLIAIPCVALTLCVSAGRRKAGRALGVAGLLVAPWLIFTTVYYGSPVPHTILAKSATYDALPHGEPILTWLVAQLSAHAATILRSFTPFFADTLVTSAPLPATLAVLVAGTTLGLMTIGLVRAVRMPIGWGVAAFTVAYLGYRAFALPTVYFDWYVPPFTAAAILLAGMGLERLRRPAAIRPVLAASLIVAFALPYPWLVAIERNVQDNVEAKVRLAVAAYLRDAVTSGEPVVSESAGYIGHASRVLLWDYPGLTSPAALATIQGIPRRDRSVAALVAAARPTWAVLRPEELDLFRSRWTEAASTYRVCASFGPGGDQIDAGGYTKRTIDLRFHVLRISGCPALPV